MLCSCHSGVCSISAVSGKDVRSATFSENESLHDSSLNLVAELFVMVVAVKRGVGGGCLRGELCFHAKILGSSPSLGLILPLRLIYLQSSGLKCLEQTLIPSNIEKSLPTSLLMAWAHCFLVLGLSGKQKKDIFSPVSLSRLSFFVHNGTQQCVGISQLISE